MRTLPSTGMHPEPHAGPQLSTRRCDIFTVLVGQRSREKHGENLTQNSSPTDGLWAAVLQACRPEPLSAAAPASGHLRSQPSTARSHPSSVACGSLLCAQESTWRDALNPWGLPSPRGSG